MEGPDKESIQKYDSNEHRSEDYASDSSNRGCSAQDSYYQEDSQCPCYMCNSGAVDSKSSYSDDNSTSIEFAIRSFWRLAKTQNDIESPMEGHCKGFHYRLLLHPRGTTGTDSESSHLSVFVEAVVQDWYPEYWVFPNVRFELTVVNFKDPKQSVTSWAHWSFSSDATSRGWQKMISHSRLTKAAGFMDEDGTVLVKGKAEPPYPFLWSKAPIYHPLMMWEYISDRAQREICSDAQSEKHAKYKLPNCNSSSSNTAPTLEENSAPSKRTNAPPYPLTENDICKCGHGSCNSPGSKTVDYKTILDKLSHESCTPSDDASSQAKQGTKSLPENKSNAVSDNALLRFLDSIVPALHPTLDSDLVALMIHVLYHLREFRRAVFMWNAQGEYENTSDNSIVLALQKTFAYMQLYPLAVSCRTYKLSSMGNSNIPKYYVYELLPKVPSNKRRFSSEDMFENLNDTSVQDSSLYNGYRKSVYDEASYDATSHEDGLGYMDQPDESHQPSGRISNANHKPTTQRCCVFDGGRFEWEVPSSAYQRSTDNDDKDRLVDGPSSANFVNQCLSSYRLIPGTLSHSIGERQDVFGKILPPPPNLKHILKAMHMTDLQVLEVQDQLVNIHTELFTMLLRDLASAKKVLKQKRLLSGSEGDNHDKNIPWFLRDQTNLEATCKSLFSGSSESEGLFHSASVNDISTIYIRCKHSHSLQKALESTAKTMARYPEVLFFYLYPTKNAKKGELFDVPLRLDGTILCETNNMNPFSGYQYDIQSNNDNEDPTAANSSEYAVNAENFETYSDEEEDDAQDEDDGEDSFADFTAEGANSDKDRIPIKWYSLYALIIREGDIRSEASGKGGSTFNSLLLRPEEDGPWYRMCEGRVEKLNTKMEFTEWKCHRDFFCSAAVYIAEDYIDMLQVGEVNLSGNLKTWNPTLYYETLEKLGITEQDILNPSPQDASSTCDVEKSMPKPEDEVNEEPEYETEQRTSDDQITEYINVSHFGIDNLVYKRKIGQRHPRLLSCCDVHGYTPAILDALNEKELRNKTFKMATQREISRRINRLETIRPFISWLFSASKENTALLNGIIPPIDGKSLVNFLQRRERIFEEEFRNLVSEIFFKEVGEHLALSSIYRWSNNSCSCGCRCKTCGTGSPALLLTENGRFPEEELRTHLSEPATILFRNIQILRCHLEYFCKDCRNLNLQMKENQRLSELHEFKATSERSALFLIECIWDACIRYTLDCRTILFLKAASDNPQSSITDISLSQTSSLSHLSGIGAKQTALHPPLGQCRDLFVFDGTQSGSSDSLEEELTNYSDTKYDLNINVELEIMHYLSNKYKLPTVSRMRNFLRKHHVLVYAFIRPHELARCYLEKKYLGCNIKDELKDAGFEITWNEDAFAQRATLESLSEDEKIRYGIGSGLNDPFKTIGNHLCNTYEELITKMLVHMQDAEKNAYSKTFDYVYTCGDISKVVEAIHIECAKTVNVDSKSLKIENDEEICTCESFLTECRLSSQHHSFLPEVTSSIEHLSWEMADLGNISTDTSHVQNDYSSLVEEFADFHLGSGDQKRKKKPKLRKQSLEKGTCIIPPLDIKLRELNINQEAAFLACPNVFIDVATLVKYSSANKKNNTSSDKQGKWGDCVSNFDVNQPYGSDANVTIGYTSLLKLDNANYRAICKQTNFNEKSESDISKVKYAVEIGIIITQDLFGLEGFASEEKLNPIRRLMVYNEYKDEVTGKTVPMRVEHLYWAMRRLFHQQIPQDFDGAFITPTKTKKTKTTPKSICGNVCTCDENECQTNLRWRPMPRDTFMLYALCPDPHPVRRGRRRFVYMQPESGLGNYIDVDRASNNYKNPDITILVVAAPTSLYNTLMPFPYPEDSEYPLLLFKWMCCDTVDLFCLGAIVCDSKKQLQQYIFEWLLPLVRELGYLPKLGQNEKDDIDQYQVLEECSIRTVQNVRRWSCAIRKINKRPGDIIITQLKRNVDSPASLRFKEAVAFMHSVRELSELEALELLPTHENTDENLDNWMKQDNANDDKPDELVQKLAKKKKRKSTKSAIPSNKKSTFSKSVYSSVEDNAKDEVSNIYQPSTDEVKTTEAEDAVVIAEKSPSSDSVNVYNIVEEALEGILKSNDFISYQDALGNGISNVNSDDFVEKLFSGDLFGDDVRNSVYLYIQQIMVDEMEVEFEVDMELTTENIPIPISPRLRACADIIISSLNEQKARDDVENILDNLYEQNSFIASCIFSYALCSIGSNRLMNKHLEGFSKGVIAKLVEHCSTHSHIIFKDDEDTTTKEQDILCYILSVLNIFYGESQGVANLFNRGQHVVFIMKLIAERTKSPQSFPTPLASPTALKHDAFERFNSKSKVEPKKSDYVLDLFNNSTLFLFHEECLEQLERLVLQELKIWWYQREILLSNMKHVLLGITKGGKITLVSKDNAYYLEGHEDQESLDFSDVHYLQQCCKRFPDELGTSLDNGKICIFANYIGSDVESESLDGLKDTLEKCKRGKKNIKRSIPNQPMRAHETMQPFSSLYDMERASNQTSLIVMSMKYSNYLKKIDSQTIGSIIQHHSRCSIQNIPPPPSIFPPQPHYVDN
ncbi:hypothetical protein BEWA_031950 [Theileria equi strain WA]|uniref:MATH domain-containing protein n=1 Tax=Theileria equi strain WA TaxID=1537102 RepID=L0AXP7_THEEQ|nr:hypothetical protein BEWA_031950 [Theileria equi strain WA]AFZ80342.1 hypothetical protein BEWA_031950 [Theileria equi strain WA]|eukprot:XP_004830008.1 hypothetical protein BEWA_031950 [Theileria equi strain WA]